MPAPSTTAQCDDKQNCQYRNELFHWMVTPTGATIHFRTTSVMVFCLPGSGSPFSLIMRQINKGCMMCRITRPSIAFIIENRRIKRAVYRHNPIIRNSVAIIKVRDNIDRNRNRKYCLCQMIVCSSKRKILCCCFQKANWKCSKLLTKEGEAGFSNCGALEDRSSIPGIKSAMFMPVIWPICPSIRIVRIALELLHEVYQV